MGLLRQLTIISDFLCFPAPPRHNPLQHLRTFFSGFYNLYNSIETVRHEILPNADNTHIKLSPQWRFILPNLVTNWLGDLGWWWARAKYFGSIHKYLTSVLGLKYFSLILWDTWQRSHAVSAYIQHHLSDREVLTEWLQEGTRNQRKNCFPSPCCSHHLWLLLLLKLIV